MPPPNAATAPPDEQARIAPTASARPSTETAPHAGLARLRRQHRQDIAFRGVTWFFAVVVFTTLAAILISLAIGSVPAFKAFGPGFLTSTEWNPVTNQYGAAIAIFGTVVTSLIALVVGIPISFGIALFLTELSPPALKRPLGTAIELLAAVPSIIYGMWGLLVFAPLFAEYVQPLLSATLGNTWLIAPLFEGAPNGIGILTAGLILSFMVIPFIASVMRDVFEIVPPVLKESAYGVGATTWEVVWNVVLPYTKVGVIGGIMLGFGRALGETMAVTFVIGNAHRISSSLYSAGNSIASTLANEFAEASHDLHLSALIALGLILFMISFVVLACAKLLLVRLAKQEGRKT